MAVPTLVGEAISRIPTSMLLFCQSRLGCPHHLHPVVVNIGTHMPVPREEGREPTRQPSVVDLRVSAVCRKVWRTSHPFVIGGRLSVTCSQALTIAERPQLVVGELDPEGMGEPPAARRI